MDQLSTGIPIEEWHERMLQKAEANDFLLFGKEQGNTIWFSTNYLQFLSRNGNSEVIPLYGKHIHDMEDVIYQLNYSLPVGYKLKTDIHALFDLLLNFETEPLRRVVFWNDADLLFKRNQTVFEDIFEAMITAAYVNRNAISTVKEDGTRYLVDQRNLFFFNGLEPKDIFYLIEKVYHIPSYDEPDLRQKLKFSLIELID